MTKTLAQGREIRMRLIGLDEQRFFVPEDMDAMIDVGVLRRERGNAEKLVTSVILLILH